MQIHSTKRSFHQREYVMFDMLMSSCYFHKLVQISIARRTFFATPDMAHQTSNFHPRRPKSDDLRRCGRPISKFRPNSPIASIVSEATPIFALPKLQSGAIKRRKSGGSVRRPLRAQTAAIKSYCEGTLLMRTTCAARRRRRRRVDKRR